MEPVPIDLGPMVAVPVPASFTDAAAALSLDFDPGDLDRFGAYLSMLEFVNRSFNLTAITDPEQMWHKHILDSLTLLPVVADIPQESHVADVGSGAGLPGIPLAIALPNLTFTLIEATAKKARFIEGVVDALKLKNVRVVCERAEVLGHMRRAHRENYAAATARALGHLAVVLELTVPLLLPSGRAILTKGQKAEQELAESAEAMQQLGVDHVGTLPTPTGTILVFEKVRPTPRTLPRRSGEPARAPIGMGAVKRAKAKDATSWGPGSDADTNTPPPP